MSPLVAHTRALFEYHRASLSPTEKKRRMVASKFDVRRDKKFLPIKDKEVKTVVDERFAALFTDDRFTKVGRKDIYGRGTRIKNVEDLTERLIYSPSKPEKKRYSGKEKKAAIGKAEAGGARAFKAKEKEAHRDSEFEKEDASIRARKGEGDSEGPSSDGENGGTTDEGEPTLNDDSDDERAARRNKSDSFHWEVSSTSSSDDDDDDEENEQRIAEEEIDAQLEDLTNKLVQEVWEEEDVEKGDATSRVALMGCDWENVMAVDLLFLSHCVLGGKVSASGKPTESDLIEGVSIYPSEFGKTRIEEEIKNGPSLEDLKVISSLKAKRRMLVEVDEEGNPIGTVSDDDDQDPEVMLAIRKYEKERAKYYYAVVTCASVDLAEKLYMELDGIDVDFAVEGLDLRFVPDTLTQFPFDPKDSAVIIPTNYTAPDSFTSALRHSHAKLNWDDDPKKRQKVLRRRFNAKEMSELDLEQYLASEDSDDSVSSTEVTASRRALLGDLAGPLKPDEDMGDGGHEESHEDRLTADTSDDDFFVIAEGKASKEDSHDVINKEPTRSHNQKHLNRKKAFPVIGLDDQPTSATLVEGQHRLLEDNSSSDGEVNKKKRRKKLGQDKMKRKRAEVAAAVEAEAEAAKQVEIDERFRLLKTDPRFHVDGTHPLVMKKRKLQKR
eukprot:Blabericola_migrator_1__654@NODE_1163_length_5233_cov_27_435927_g793_i0_p1_GENE_NODE_1163_length_5233_cov_27_435927_g793_i0NODE_1163_length_5233_cov_27_435927_g793_i0_p1_ORF_typecomplete_len666_score182_88NUC153/PF08159_12/0_26NUC153/PF08159_12/11DUF3246/PF11596_8/0_86_NODE_1163_length_5233_cov_27_435927_g793_i01022099